MRFMLRLFLLILLLQPMPLLLGDAAIYQNDIIIPTYGVDKPDPNPRFYAGRVYQGAQGRIYPYPMSDVLTNKKEDKIYKAVTLENDYIKISVLPEIGGRIFEAVDKTNNYNFFYRQSVIKPSLIGMLGAWISGGVEWNFPHHHRANTFMPMDFLIIENIDGSKTVWLTEIERRHRMKMLIGLTIWPDSNILQAEFKFFNRTPFVHSFLYFANPAVHVDTTYQVIFPPEVEYVTQHAKREYARWPIADTYYGGFDYKNVDISWWKNLPKPVSFFAWDHTSDYFGGYDHGKDAGVAYIADVFFAPGKKFFTFGCGDQGQMWDKMLTDTDGPYLELMAGAYSDNQPDYSWIQPYETKTIKQFWYPIRDLGGLSFANLNGALYFEKNGQKAWLNILTTKAYEQTNVTLTVDKNIVWQHQANISPQNVLQAEITLPQQIKTTDIVISVHTADGKELLSYQTVARAGASMPEPVKPPARPEDYETAEELYFTGLRLDEFHNPQMESYPYYMEALKRDSNDVRVNTQLGILYCKRGMWQAAEEHLQRAVRRLTTNYTRPKNGEPHYYLGCALCALGKKVNAYDAFSRAAWNFAWRAAAFYELALLDCLQQDFEKALQHINEALIVNSLNTKALNLKTVILRRLERLDDAIKTNEQTIAIDPLDYWALNECAEIQKIVASKAIAKQAHLACAKQMQIDPQLYLEVATDYGNAGFYREAIEVLKRSPVTDYPLISYYLAYYSHLVGDEAVAAYFVVHASTMPHDYCFPYRLETIDVLNYATEQQPQDANAFYYLGNLLFDLQPDVAIRAWEKAVALDPEFAIAFRNLGVAYSQTCNDIPTAISFYEKAIDINKKDPRYYYELDVLYEAANTEPDKRLELLKKNKKTVAKRDDALARLTALYVLTGDFDAAIKILTTHHFNVWEGGGDIHDVFVDAHLLRGLSYMRDGQNSLALADFQMADQYPDNLEVGRPIYDQNAGRVAFFLGQLYEQLDQKTKSQHFYQIAAAHETRDELSFYQAMALRKLSRQKEADALFDRLVANGNKQTKSNEDIDFFAKFGQKSQQNSRLARAHYFIALGHLGKGEPDLARTALASAQELDINNPWINYYAELLSTENKW
ncbi:DUF5107 domain-containing protein [candidate division KSB1 bacterium]|nr:DUF5107 domain-containing protein [candidate division KSB1 bacterium]